MDDKLKKLVNATISRGKTELALTVVNIGAPEASISVNLDLAKGYLDAIGEMSSALGVENDVTAGTLTRFQISSPHARQRRTRSSCGRT